MADKFIIKSENIIGYEIERDDYFPAIRESLNEERVEEINEHNAEFNEKILIPYISQFATPCNCQMNKITERTMQRARLLGRTPTTLDIEQEDIDTRFFAPIISLVDGKRMKIESLVCQCKECRQITLYGDLIPFANMLADYTSQYLTMLDQAEAQNKEECVDCESCGDTTCSTTTPDKVIDPEQGYVLEDLETGELSTPNNLVSDDVDADPNV